MEKFLWCQPNDILFPIPTHRIWDTCHLISYKIPIPMIILSYEPKEALIFLFPLPVPRVVSSSSCHEMGEEGEWYFTTC